jgi:UDPglucose 6-dehydrogenase
MDINDDRRSQLVENIRAAVGPLKGKSIGILGLTFKPNTDDLRDAPALDVARMLLEAGATVQAYDPVAMGLAADILPEVKMAQDPYQMANGVDALVVCTEWNEFKQLDLDQIRTAMKMPVIVDGRNIYNPAELAGLGFAYHGMGRGIETDVNFISEEMAREAT